MVPMVEPMVPHVPAWKKLGLKLKYAKDTPDDVIHTGDSAPNSRKRGPPESRLIAENTPTKKPKKSVSTSTEKPKRKDATPIQPSATQQEQQTPQSPIAAPCLTKRKSVTFTPDTKTEDGDSIKQLYHTWLAEQKAEDHSFTPDHAGQALKLASPSPLPPSNEPPATKAKKPKKAQPSKPAPPQPNPPSPALKYLTHHHTSLPTWKFSKAKQTTLLKHVFSPSLIPPTHDPALSSYLSGLRGANARSRIRATASTIITADEESLSAEPGPEAADMDDPALRRAHYQHALQRYKAQLRGLELEREERERELDPAWRARLLKRKRAELVLETSNVNIITFVLSKMLTKAT
ncbi:Protein of unknown function DUF2373 [Lasallia pustulata]|uniref:WKF domain-containing protein n=1 Tax=Lasallia pustulata TaxID=136370 RepID=A0A1W5DDC9_9LECA|nr:Protein of unknown function DUF2373 [Lasallia pustulata]